MAFSICLTLLPNTLWAKSTITLYNLDSPNEGFNDPTEVAPIGGNTGTTLGEQRWIALRHASDLLEIILASDVSIEIGVSFTDMGGEAFAAPLAEAGPNTFHYDFNGALVQSTMYGPSLANKLNGSDLAPASECESLNIAKTFCYDINATFNSAVDTNNALTGTTWYYGLDGETVDENTLSHALDYITVVLHEFMHGLGFITLVDLKTGEQYYRDENGNFLQDIYSRFVVLKDGSPSAFTDMTNEQRLSAISSTHRLLWSGTQANQAASHFPTGPIDGRLSLYAPETIELGASVSHTDPDFTPNDIMEPFYNQPSHTPGLGGAVLADIGWGALADLAVNYTPGANPAFVNVETPYHFSVSNFGDFTAPETTLTYTLPAQTRYVSGTAEGGQCGLIDQSTVQCSLGNVLPKSTKRVTLTLIHDASSTLTHTCEVFGNIVDSIPTNNQAASISTSTSAPPTNTLPTINFETGADISASSGDVITLDATASSSASSTITNYTFEAVSNDSIRLTTLNPGIVTVTAPSNGEDLTIKVTVTDDQGNSSSELVIIAVNNPPSVSITASDSVSPNSSVTLDGSNSSDSDGQITRYQWEQISGPTVTLQDSSATITTFTAPSSDASLRFRLTITDNAGSSSSTEKSIQVSTPAQRSGSGGGNVSAWCSLGLIALYFLRNLCLLRIPFYRRTQIFSRHKTY